MLCFRKRRLCAELGEMHDKTAHLFIGALRVTGDTCPLPGSFSRQNHSGGRKSHINRKFTTYFTTTSFMSEGCRARIGSALGCWCVCVLLWPLTWRHYIHLSRFSVSGCICLESANQEPKEEAVDRYQQVQKGKPGIIEEPNRGRGVRLAGDGRQRQWG